MNHNAEVEILRCEVKRLQTEIAELSRLIVFVPLASTALAFFVIYAIQWLGAL